MTTNYPLTVYYDAACALCNSEIHHLKRHDTDSRLLLIDCSAPAFDDRPFRAEGISQDTLLKCLHVRDSQGNWLRGVEAFEVIYGSVGLQRIARLWGHPWIRPLAERLYPWVARYRQQLSACGAHKLFSLWSRQAPAKRHPHNSACTTGRCPPRPTAKPTRRDRPTSH